ncbi:MAG TPA: PHP domain-containing protein [Clostridia bacterium]|nr:PHP domain-containing protein [Clostridia bacterium]
MKAAGADLHVHSVLSPCAGDEMTPPLVLARAVEQGLRFIAITDHNSTLNVPAFWEAAKNYPIQVVPGLELQTREDVHLVCLFDTPEKAFRLQEIVDRTLPRVKNREEFFGPQWIVDACGRITGTEDRLLLNSLDLSLTEAAAEVVRIGGVCIAAHVNRQGFSLPGVLGLIPPELPLAALEISDPQSVSTLSHTYQWFKRYQLVFSSDAHYLVDLGKVRTMLPEEIDNTAVLIDFFRHAMENQQLSKS